MGVALVQTLNVFVDGVIEAPMHIFVSVHVMPLAFKHQGETPAPYQGV
jgi:hypothetical protein